MSDFRHNRVIGVVWSVFASELGIGVEAAQQERQAHYLRPALWSLRAGEMLDDWAVIDLPPRTFYALLAGAEVLQAGELLQRAGLVEAWCRRNEESLAGEEKPISPPSGLDWARTQADLRNVVMVLGVSGYPAQLPEMVPAAPVTAADIQCLGAAVRA